jgi:hypothetical protein
MSLTPRTSRRGEATLRALFFGGNNCPASSFRYGPPRGRFAPFVASLNKTGSELARTLAIGACELLFWRIVNVIPTTPTGDSSDPIPL